MVGNLFCFIAKFFIFILAIMILLKLTIFFFDFLIFLKLVFCSENFIRYYNPDEEFENSNIDLEIRQKNKMVLDFITLSVFC